MPTTTIIGATPKEVAKLCGDLEFLQRMVRTIRKAHGEKSYKHISQTMEDAINESSEVADKVRHFGLQEAK